MNPEGEIRDIRLTDRLIELWRERFTGAIRFENDGIIKIIYFKEGDVLSASTNDRADSVDEILMRAGKVSKEHVKQALSKRKENETLGDALLTLGFITRKELSWARRIQVVNVIRSVSEWNAGTFNMVADYLPKREEGTSFPLPQLIVEMIVTDQDRGKYERLLESGTAVFQKAAGQDEAFRRLGLNEDAEAVMAQVDGARTASEVAASSRQETFNAFKLMHALSVLGILERQGAPLARSTLSGSFEALGVADAADAWGASPAQFELMDVSAVPPSSAAANDVPAVSLNEEPVVAPASRTPAWDLPPRGASPAIAPSPEPPAEASQTKWGFDEQPAATPPPPPPPPVERTRSRPAAAAPTEGTMTRRSKAALAAKAQPQRRYGLLIAVMVVFILAGAAYFAYAWWSSREQGAAAQPPAPVTQTAPPPAASPEPAAPQTAATATVATATAASPVAPTPTPVPASAPGPRSPEPGPPAGDRSRYEAMARAFAANPGASFTVQFAIVCEPSNVTKALRGSGAGEVWFIPIALGERSCYRMFWGRFATRDEAERGMSRLPSEYRESRAAVVAVPR